MVLVTVAFTIAIALLFGITTGYLVIVSLLRMFGARTRAASEETPALAAIPVPTPHAGR